MSFKLFETLIWVEIEGGCRGRGSPCENLSCHLFPRRKTGTNLPREAIPTPPPPPSPALSGSDGGIIFFIFIFACSRFLELINL